MPTVGARPLSVAIRTFVFCISTSGILTLVGVLRCSPLCFFVHFLGNWFCIVLSAGEQMRVCVPLLVLTLFSPCPVTFFFYCCAPHRN